MLMETRERFRRYADPAEFEKIVEFGDFVSMWKHCVSEYANLPAVGDEGKTLSFQELDEDAAKYRRVLSDAGLKKGMRAALLVPNSYDFVKAFVAAETLGVSLAILPVQLPAPAVFGCLMKFQAKALIYAPQFEETVAFAKERGKLITFDPNLRPPLWRSLDDAREQMLWGLGQADVVKLSDNEVGFLFGLSPREGAAYIRERFGTQLVFVTCGADGCEFASLRAQGHVDGLKGLTVTDTTGAGDIFGGCAVWRLLQSGKAPAALDEAELRGIAEFACRVAGRSTEKSGGISAITEMPDEVFMG